MTSCLVVRSISSMRDGDEREVLAADRRGRAARDEACVLHRVARRELHLEPRGEAAVGRPEGAKSPGV